MLNLNNKGEVAHSNYQKKLLKELQKTDPEFQIKVIDLESCIYRNYGNFDIEIQNTLKEGDLATIYVWDISKGMGYGATMIKKIKAVAHKDILSEVNIVAQTLGIDIL